MQITTQIETKVRAMFNLKRFPFPRWRVIMNGKSLNALREFSIFLPDPWWFMEAITMIFYATRNLRIYCCCSRPCSEHFTSVFPISQNDWNVAFCTQLSLAAMWYWRGISNHKRTCKRTTCDFTWFVTFYLNFDSLCCWWNVDGNFFFEKRWPCGVLNLCEVNSFWDSIFC